VFGGGRTAFRVFLVRAIVILLVVLSSFLASLGRAMKRKAAVGADVGLAVSKAIKGSSGESLDEQLVLCRAAKFLMKSEPYEFSIHQLKTEPNSTGRWDGVRNAVARNIMRGMKKGDIAYFYHRCIYHVNSIVPALRTIYTVSLCVVVPLPFVGFVTLFCNCPTVRPDTLATRRKRRVLSEQSRLSKKLTPTLRLWTASTSTTMPSAKIPPSGRR
jgi:EVE domain